MAMKYDTNTADPNYENIKFLKRTTKSDAFEITEIQKASELISEQ